MPTRSRSLLRQLLRDAAKPKKQEAEKPNVPTDPSFSELSMFEKGMDILQRGQYTVAGAAKAALTGKNPFTAALKGAAGIERTNFGEVLKTAGMKDDTARAAIGFALDIVADPTTYLGVGAVGKAGTVAIKGVAKPITKAGVATLEALKTAKTAQAAKILAKTTKEGVPRLSPARLESLLKGAGHLTPEVLTEAAEKTGKALSPDLAAKALGSGYGKRAFGEILEKKAPALPKGIEIPKVALEAPTALKFAGKPILMGSTVSKALKPVKVAYGAAEKLPVVGPALKAGKDFLKATGGAIKSVFSTKTGRPEFDALRTHYRDIINLETKEAGESWMKEIADPMLAKAFAKDPEALKLAKTDLVKTLEGVREQTIKLEAPAARAVIQKKMDEFVERLETLAGKKAEFEAGAAQTAKAIKAQEGAKANVPTAAAQKVGELEPKLQKVATRIALKELGTGYIKAIDEITGILAAKKFEKISAEETAKITGKITGLKAQLETLEKGPKRLLLQSQIEALENKIAAVKRGLEAVPMRPVMYETRAPYQSPIAGIREIAEKFRSRMEAVYERERKWLSLPPEHREFYMPHYLEPEIKDALYKILRQDANLILKPDKLASAMRRTQQGGVLDLSLNDLIESGAVDPLKVKAELKKAGIEVSPTNMLVFESDPIKAGLRREIASIRAVNAAKFADDIFNSPTFVKSKGNILDPVSLKNLKQMASQNPDHAIFVPSKTYIQRFLSKTEQEALRSGKDPFIDMLKEVLPSKLDEFAAKTAAAGGDAAKVEAYVIPKEIAEHLSKAHKLEFADERMAEFIRQFDKAQGWWKLFATAVRPAFHVRNMISNFWQNWLAGLKDPRVYHQAWLMRTPEGRAKVAGVGKWSADEVYRLAEQTGVLRGGFIGDVAEYVDRTATKTGFTPQHGALKGIPGAGVLYPTGPAARLGTKAGNIVEEHARLALFIDSLKKGMDPASAAMHVKKYLFDYSDLTKIERGVLKRLLPFYCVDEETECLTEYGWRRYDKIEAGTRALVQDVETGEFKWSPILEVAVFDFDGELNKHKNRSSDILCTDEHRWPMRKDQGIRRGEVEVRRANELKTGWSFICTGEFKGDESILTPKEAAILGWIVTDGYHRWRGNYCEMMVYQSQNKYLDEIVALTNGRPRKPHPDTGVVCVAVPLNETERIRKVFRSKADMPFIVSRLSREAAEAMKDAMFKAEGCIGETKPGCYERNFAQYAPDVRDAFQILCLLTGETMNTGKRGGYIRNGKTVKFSGWERQPYKGKVWCVRTETGTWVQRRGGRTVVTGNTFTRKSIPLALETLLTQPGKVAALGKLRSESEAAFSDLNHEYVADYINEAFGVPVHKDPKTGEISYFLLKGYIPTVDLAKMDAKEILGMMSPFIKEPIEQFTNTDFFRMKPISRFPTEMVEFMGAPMPARLAHLMRNVVIMAQIDREVFREGATPGKMLASELSFRLQTQNPEDQLKRYVLSSQMEMGEMKRAMERAREAGKDFVANQFEGQYTLLAARRNNAKAQLLSINPNAFKRGGPKKPKPPPTFESLKRKLRERTTLKSLMKQPKKTGTEK